MQQEWEHGREYNFDQPEAVDIAQLYQHLSALKKGESIQKPIYCMKSSEPIGTETIHPARLVIMEWLFALTDELSQTGDLNIFVQASTTTRLIRRVNRDTTRKNQNVKSIVGYFEHYVEPMHEKHVEPTSKNAHIILENELWNNEIEEGTKNEVVERYLEKIFTRKLRENTSQ